MIVYVDMICLLNILLDFILLMSVSVVLTRNTKLIKLVLGSMIGGVSTLLLFIKLNSIVLFSLKIILGIIMSLVSFGYKDIRYTFNNIFYLFTISFSVGGIMYLFIDNKIYNYAFLVISFLIICFLYIKQIRKYKDNYNNYYHVDIYVNNTKLSVIGYLDTGNKLYDNYKHRPIILIDRKIKYRLEDIIYVPYSSLNSDDILKCLKVDKIIINKRIFKNYLIGLSEKKIRIDGVNCILHSKMKGMI